ncbi:hypothetical protein GCM10023149_25590 [Mucilaginibacter gynuensis]|uniref:Alpha-galactosidase n=1 Tax=Mucilaginibacter gynuensis TaxID=1302236 RepID=A0ABP8GGY5_9SPHI
MRKLLSILCIAACGLTAQAQQKLYLSKPKFSTGNQTEWSDPKFNDASWKTIDPTILWEKQGYDYTGFAWYRFHVVIPSSLKEKSALKDSLTVYLARIDDSDEAYFNGVKIGKTGTTIEDAQGYNGMFGAERKYTFALNKVPVNWDKENVIAVKVYDGGGDGGMYSEKPYLAMRDYIDGVVVNTSKGFSFAGAFATKDIILENNNSVALSGSLSVQLKDGPDKVLKQTPYTFTLAAHEKKVFKVKEANKEGAYLNYVFTEKTTGKKIEQREEIPYILTPKAPLTPRINGAEVTGVRPNSPFLYKVAATGQKPIQYAAAQLPEGLTIDKATGIITGAVSKAGDYPVKLTVTNKLGKAQRTLTIKVGSLLGLTPAMGWNSWNCWGLSVTTDKVKASAQALIDKGLIDHGWTYINIDDGWESAKRNDDGTIGTNEKFPDLKALGDWLHSHGLKFGIYSSPGDLTCGGYLGSYKHELQDAESYAKWGVDYLKHDWCSYSSVAGNDTSLETFVKPYRVMEQALRAQPRDIYYSLCQYGMKDVWKWGDKVDANSWRTTGDITDTWESLHDIGFSQYKIADYPKPGRWNDPDMLIVGKVGWSGSLRNTRLTPNEQYTHISLWSLQASPLLIGCDISQLDEFTLSLLTNDEVIAVNQDVLGKQAHRVLANDDFQVYVKELADGSKAIGVFNMKTTYTKASVKWSDIKLSLPKKVRDLWRQKDLTAVTSTFSNTLPPHGVVMVKVK